MMKVLLAEDNEMSRGMLSRRLEKNGYEVAIAAHDREGVSMASSDRRLSFLWT